MIDFATLRPQMRRYVRASLWLARDGFTTGRRRVVLIIIVNFIGITTAASSMGLILWYLKWAQKPSPVVFRGWEIPLSTGTGSLLLVGLAALLIGLASVLCVFYSEWSVQRLSRDYQKVCMKRILRCAGHPRLGRIIIAAEHAMGRPVMIKDLLNAGSRFSAFALRAIVQLFLPVSTMILAIAFLFIVNWVVTVLVAGLTVFYLVPMYLINRGVARQQRFYRATLPSVSRRLVTTLRSLVQTSGPIRNSPEIWYEKLLSDDEFNQLQDALYGRILASRKSNFVNGVFLVVCVFALFVMFSMTAGQEGISWAALLAYIVALRFALRGLQQVTVCLTNVSRFFPEYEQYSTFIQAAEAFGWETELEPSARGPLPLRIIARGEADPALDSTADRIELDKGDRALIVYPQVIDRIAMERASLEFCSSRSQRACLNGAAYHESPQPVPLVSVIVNALGEQPADEDVESLHAVLARLGVLEELRSLPRELQTELTSAQISSLSPEARYGVTAAYCLLRPPEFLFLSLSGLEGLKPEFQAAFVDGLSESCVVFVTSAPKRLFRPTLKPVRDRIDRAAILVSDGVVRCGSIDWLESRLPVVESLLKSLIGEPAADTDQIEDEEDVDDM